MDVQFISHRGAQAGEANLHELRWPSGRLLLDCGADGQSADVLGQLQRPGAVWISHAHGDHCGGLLKLASRWPRMDVMATETTKRLLGFSLAGVDETGGRRAESVARRVKPVPMQRFEPIPGCQGAQIMALGAGHVPGAAMALVRLPDDTCVLYTGDFCTHDQAVVEGAGIPKLKGNTQIDAVVMESMLATDEEADRIDWGDEASSMVEEIRQADGAVLIGVSAVGESVEVATLLAEAGLDVMVDDYLRPVFEATGASTVRIDFGDRRRMKHRLVAGATVVAVGDQYQRATTAARLAAALLDDGSATLVVLNRARSRTGAGRLVETNRGESIRWAGRQMPLEATVVHRRLINHAPRWQLEAMIRGVGAAKTLLVHGPTGARWALKRSVEKGGYDGEVVVVEGGLALGAGR